MLHKKTSRWMYRQSLLWMVFCAVCVGYGCGSTHAVRSIPSVPIRELPDGHATAERPALVLQRATAELPREPTNSRILELEPRPSSSTLTAVVVAFFVALSNHNRERLHHLLWAQATAIDQEGNQTDLAERWATRLARFDYRLTKEQPAFFAPDLRVIAVDDDRAAAVVALLKPTGTDYLVFAPLTKTEYRGQQLFGDALWFQLRRDGKNYRILAVFEEFALPP